MDIYALIASSVSSSEEKSFVAPSPASSVQKKSFARKAKKEKPVVGGLIIETPRLDHQGFLDAIKASKFVVEDGKRKLSTPQQEASAMQKALRQYVGESKGQLTLPQQIDNARRGAATAVRGFEASNKIEGASFVAGMPQTTERLIAHIEGRRRSMIEQLAPLQGELDSLRFKRARTSNLSELAVYDRLISEKQAKVDELSSIVDKINEELSRV